MFAFIATLRGKVIGATGVLVLFGLLLLTATNLWTARQKRPGLTDRANPGAVPVRTAAGVADWVASRHQVVKSVASKVGEGDPFLYLQGAKIAGDVDSVYIGYPTSAPLSPRHKHFPPTTTQPHVPGTNKPLESAARWSPEPYIDAASKKLVITFASAIRSADKLQAVTAADVFMDGVVRNIASIRPTP